MRSDTEAERIAGLAEHHESQGILFARQAKNNAPWYHGHGADTRRAADHFAVAAGLRSILEAREEEHGSQSIRSMGDSDHG